jgi:hypothetical protein
MAEKREYRLKIDAYSPETMPMKRLAEYLSDMAVLLGDESSVHLIAIESSSTCPVVLVDWEAEPKVIDRLSKVRNKEGPEDAMKAAERIDARLASDNTSAAIIAPAKNRVLEFPGVNRPRPIEWPSINQAGQLIGIPIAVGGKQEQVPVHLQDGNEEYFLLATRGKAKEIAVHLFTTTIRVTGRGRWRKAPGGPWALERFMVDDFEPLGIADFGDAISKLRAIDAEWKHREDPLSELDEIRHSEQ